MGRKRIATCHRCGHKWKLRVIKPYVVCPSCRTSVKVIDSNKYVSPFEKELKELKIEFYAFKKQLEEFIEVWKNERKNY
jgi:Zn finger protein HypA/HybF involved in hydrogenase expression